MAYTTIFLKLLWLLYFVHNNDGAFQCLVIDNFKITLEFSNNNEPNPAFPDMIKYIDVMNDACDGLESSITNLYLSVIEKVLLNNGSYGTLMFYCGKEKLARSLILKRYINKFERNRPQNWYKDNTTTFGCRDSYNRSIPLPIGVQRCFTSQSSTIKELTLSGPNFTKSFSSGSYGEHEGRDFEHGQCGFNFDFSSGYNNASTFLSDGHCKLSLSLNSIGYVCCCYKNGSACANGIINNPNLACPVIPFSQTIDTNNDTNNDFSSDNQTTTKIINAKDMFIDAEQQCYFRMNIRRQGTSSLLNVTASYGIEEDEICLNWRQKGDNEGGCKKVDRLCLDDIDDSHDYCCTFKAVKGIQKEVMSTHDQWAVLLYGDAMNDLSNTTNCFRPFIGSDDCIFFFYPPRKEFVNIQIDKNFIIYKSQKEKLNKFITKPLSLNQSFTTLVGRIKYYMFEDKQRQKCNSKNPLNAKTPIWYKNKFLVVRCKSLNGGRCDDWTTENGVANATGLVDLVEGNIDGRKSMYEYPCLNATNHTIFDWEPFCVEAITINESISSEPIKEKSHLQLEHASYYLDKFEKQNISDEENAGISTRFYCSQNENRIWCVCIAKGEPCNYGKIVDTRYLVSKQPELEFVKNGSECTMRTSENEMQCSDNREITNSQKCYFLITESMNKTLVGCLQEKSLKHNYKNYRIDNEKWYLYQTCEHLLQNGATPTVNNADNFHCSIVIDKKLQTNSPTIICCCEAEACDAAATWISKKLPWKTFDKFL